MKKLIKFLTSSTTFICFLLVEFIPSDVQAQLGHSCGVLVTNSQVRGSLARAALQFRVNFLLSKGSSVVNGGNGPGQHLKIKPHEAIDPVHEAINKVDQMIAQIEELASVASFARETQILLSIKVIEVRGLERFLLRFGLAYSNKMKILKETEATLRDSLIQLSEKLDEFLAQFSTQPGSLGGELIEFLQKVRQSMGSGSTESIILSHLIEDVVSQLNDYSLLLDALQKLRGLAKPPDNMASNSGYLPKLGLGLTSVVEQATNFFQKLENPEHPGGQGGVALRTALPEVVLDANLRFLERRRNTDGVK